MNKPIKRHPALQPLSRDHHFGLLLCWKIREGFRLGVETKRIRDYAQWFWCEHLQSHFKEEEEAFVSVLGTDHPLMVQLFREHKELKDLFAFPRENKDEDTLSEIKEKLNQHIRFEERVLFRKIQETATEEQLKVVESHHHDDFEDNWKDEFWIKKNEDENL